MEMDGCVGMCRWGPRHAYLLRRSRRVLYFACARSQLPRKDGDLDQMKRFKQRRNMKEPVILQHQAKARQRSAVNVKVAPIPFCFSSGSTPALWDSFNRSHYCERANIHAGRPCILTCAPANEMWTLCIFRPIQEITWVVGHRLWAIMSSE